MHDDVERPETGPRPGSGLPLPPRTLAGFAVAFLSVGVVFFFTWQTLLNRTRAGAQVAHTREVAAALEQALSSLKDAETGQRGYLLTGDEHYLSPFTRASGDSPQALAHLQALLGDNPAQLARAARLVPLVNEKFAELVRTIELRREGDRPAADAILRTGHGQAVMEQIRALVAEMQREEARLLELHEKEWLAAARLSTWATGGGSALLAILIGLAALVSARNHRAREAEAWLRQGLLGLSARVQGEQQLEALGNGVLSWLAEYLEARVGAIHVAEGEHAYRRIAGYALEQAPATGQVLTAAGQGLVGQVARDMKPLQVKGVPAGYLPISSSLGGAPAQTLLIAPAVARGATQAVVELGFMRAVGGLELEFLRRASFSIGMAVSSSRDRTHLEALLEETQRQAEQLQSQHEELHTSNEELEEQSRALRESQARLEEQQAELELTNAQLGEQTESLERANHYKSEFLANMSHELRTPLNSSLILSRLLAENKSGNLSAEQVRYAQTISAAGDDLLVLINDILDLAKIESGKIDVQLEPLELAQVLEPLVSTFQPAAKEKGLAFSLVVEPGTPPTLVSDAQRLGQILKNLLSNALKFTERGDLKLSVGRAPGGRIAFAVSDTGIGIPAHQQEVIFEAFRQADGSTQRRFGGTGLGLSISRELAQLLGGELSVRSAAGQGSVFTLTVPELPVSKAQQWLRSRLAPVGPAEGTTLPWPDLTLAPPTIEDDRAALGPASRIILVIEHDLRLATVLRDLARELGFQAVLTHSAADGLAATVRFTPHAVLLDVNLPDRSGPGAREQLERELRTRHVPVHRVSAADASPQAPGPGAVGYALQPVKREELVQSLRALERRVDQRLRRVLVVEDDAGQRESVRALLEAEGVEIVAVATATEALDAVKPGAFDCMVLDLTLPDLTGFELLEKLAEREGSPAPPVIVYTGRSLSRLEEQDLLRFARTIIIKDERSAERLLDEVTLFLHQVEARLPGDRQRMNREARHREADLEGRRILVVEDDVRSVFALSSVFEPRGARVRIARNGKEALAALAQSAADPSQEVHLVLMDIMMPEMDGLTAMKAIRREPRWQKLPIIALTAKAMKDDREQCLAAGANDYLAKPLDVEKLLSLVRVWMPRA